MTRRRKFALFGGVPLFAEAKPTGNLYRPNIEAFLEYSRSMYRSQRYSDEGELCCQLDSRLAEFHAVTRVVSVAAGFWGHVLAIAALALPGRKEVIAPAFGYRRTDDMIAWAGYVPHFCDIDPANLAASVDTINRELNDQTALILAPHPMVDCCDAENIESLGLNLGIPVVFDSVEAGYRAYANRRIGGFGNAEVFSMHSTKLLNGFEGGYITTNDEQLADRLGEMKRCGLARSGTITNGKALNAKLNEVHAAMALASLDEVDDQIVLNRRKHDLYAEGLRLVDGLTLLPHKVAERPDYRLNVVRLGTTWPLSRSETLRLLEAENILARSYYSPLHHKAVDFPRICPPLPVTEAIHQDFMVLPSGAHVLEADVEQIVDALSDIRQRGSELKSSFSSEAK